MKPILRCLFVLFAALPLSAADQVVLNNADVGPGSLRQAILDVGSGETITFDASLDGGTVTLSGGQLVIDKALTIDASSLGSGLTIDANDASRHFSLNDGNDSHRIAVALTGLTLINGSALGGGSIHTREYLALTDCILQDNNASNSGGGLHIHSVANAALSNCTFRNNTANGGGGVFNASQSTPTISGCSFLNNSASTIGGGIWNSFSSAIITNCSFEGNEGDSSGGGAHLEGGDPQFTNCTFLGNRSGSSGGGLFIISSTAIITNCSFQGNSAGTAGGGAATFFGEQSSFHNCIFWNNHDGDTGTGTASSALDSFGDSPSINYSLVQGETPVGTENLDGTLVANDPLFVSEVLATSAPITGGDLRLMTTSPVRNLGDNTANSSPLDLDGNPRIVGDIDLGAFETAPNLLVTNANNSGHSSLRHVVNNAASGDVIGFDNSLNGQTITLTGSSEILVDVDVIIDGSSLLDGVTVDGQQNGRVFKVASGTTATFKGFTITGGRTPDGNDGDNGTIGIGNPIGPGGTGDNGGDSDPGGGILNEGTLTLTNMTIRDCATGKGGNGGNGGAGVPVGIPGHGGNAGDGGCIHNTGLLTAINCTIVDNTTGRGGNGGVGTGFGNRGSGGNGGGIYNDGTLTSNHNTLTGNAAGFFGNIGQVGTAGEGGGIFNESGIVAIGNTIVAQNTALSSGPDYEGAVFWNAELNFFGDPTGATGIGTLNTDYLTGDPMLAALADNGGPTLTRAPLPGSPVIDSANGDTYSGFLFDQRGAPRLSNAIADLGTVEAYTAHVDLSATHGLANGVDWSNAYLTLQDALNADAVPHEIWVAQGTYYPDEGAGQTDDERTSTFQLLEAVNLFGGFPTGGGNGNFAARDIAAYPTILSGDLKQDGSSNTIDDAYHLVSADSSITSSFILNGLTFSSSRANSADPLGRKGGGLLLVSASPQITDCTFTDHIASDGAAVFIGQDSDPVFTRCRFVDNNSVMGGAVFLHTTSAPSFVLCSFENNLSTQHGGAVRSEAAAEITYTRCDFINNFAGGGAGAVSAQTNTNATFKNCAFKGNSANNWGGAVFNNQFSTNTFINCVFSGGSADTGGACYNNDNAAPVYINCTFSGNNARIGGAFYNDNSNPDLTNCIVWNNRSYSSGIGTQAASASNNGTSTPTYDHCLIQAYNPGGINLNGTDANNDPLFVTSIDPTRTPTSAGDLRLLATSPALDTGDHDVYAAATGPTTDLANNLRTIDETNVVDTGVGATATYLDLGAFEGAFEITFALLHPFLNPNGDANGNGFINFQEYAAGGDPTAPHDPSLFPVTSDGQFTFSFRNNAVDLSFLLQKSTTVQAGSWQDMVKDFDYTSNSDVTNGGQTIRTIDLLSPVTDEDHIFFRQGFSETP